MKQRGKRKRTLQDSGPLPEIYVPPIAKPRRLRPIPTALHRVIWRLVGASMPVRRILGLLLTVVCACAFALSNSGNWFSG